MHLNQRLCIVIAAIVCGVVFAGRPASAQTQIQPGQVIISELRLRGPAGAEDEFIEIYNNTNVPITVQATDQTAGWSVWISNGQITGPLFTIPNGTIIPGRGHYLGANVNGYSLCEYPSGNGTSIPTTAAATTAGGATTALVAAPCLTNGVGGTFSHTTPDATWDFDAPDGVGVALFSTTSGLNQTVATRLDAFGFTGAPALYREGAGFPTVITLNAQHSYYRDLRNVTPRDTGDNATDFLLVGTNGGVPGVQTIPLLGAPGPENLNSPIQRNSEFTFALLDPVVGASAPPNRSREFTSDPVNNSDFGTLLIRRTVTNNTLMTVSRLRFRIINITTLGTPNSECGGTPCADLRARTSVDSEVNTTGGLVELRGVRLEEPPEQAAGGGYNSSLSADFITLNTPLATGGSVNIEFRLGIMRTGPFRFFINIEAQNGSALSSTSSGGSRVTTGVKQRRVMMEANQPAANVAAPSPAAASPRGAYVPLFINTRTPAANPTRVVEDKADDESEEKESKDAPQTPAASAPDSSAAAADNLAPAATRRAPSKKLPAAAKAPRRGGQ